MFPARIGLRELKHLQIVPLTLAQSSYNSVVRGMRHIQFRQESTSSRSTVAERMSKVNSNLESPSYSSTVDENEDTVYIPPSLHNLPSRWAEMKRVDEPLADEIEEYLDWKMEDDWHEMSREEAIAAYYISYGPWGPRATTTASSNPAYLAIRFAFNLTLLAACGVTLYNLLADKKSSKVGSAFVESHAQDETSVKK